MMIDATDPANWPKGPLTGKTVRITAETSAHKGQIFEVVSDMHPVFPIVGILADGHPTPMAFIDGEYEVVEA